MSKVERIEKICILGGGTAGWMTAAGLAHKLEGLGPSIRLVESDQIGTVGVGEATLPHIRYFNKSLGIDEPELMRATEATFKLGIEFCDWGKLGDKYIHPFGDYGQPVSNVGFHHYWRKMQQMGDTSRLDDYSYPIVAAELGKFKLPSEDLNSIESTFSYAFQFDATLYGKYLRRYAERKGVVRTEGKAEDVTLHPENGFVKSITLASGEIIEADLFIDCSGFRGVLIEQALKSGYEDWSHWLPCNRAVAVPCEAKGKSVPYTRATARKAGWQWRIPLQHRTGNGHVYWNEFISDDEAAHQLTSTLEGKALADVNQLYFQTGRRKKFFNKNVVAIGLAGGFLEPLESTSIHLIQAGITTLLELFPDKACDLRDAEEYNQTLGQEFDRIRDFLVLHYVATERDDSEMWRYFQAMKLPESLQYKIDAFKERGHIVKYEFGLFLPPSWIAVMLGQGIVPDQYDPLVDRADPTKMLQQITELKNLTRQAAEATPDHAVFLQQYGAASGTAALMAT